MTEAWAPSSWRSVFPKAFLRKSGTSIIRKPSAPSIAAYFEAGSDAVLTNSFGGSRIKLAGHGDEKRAALLNKEAARLVRRIVPEGAFVGGSMGPTGKFLKPQGEYTEKEFEEAYAEQAEALTEGGVDFLHIETQYDLREALAALHGARKASPLPVFITLTFNNLRRGFFTLMGNGLRQFVDSMESEGVPILGANCTVNSEEMVGLIRDLRSMTQLPIIAKANAGKPRSRSGWNGFIFSRAGGIRPFHSGNHGRRSEHHRRLLRNRARAYPEDGENRQALNETLRERRRPMAVESFYRSIREAVIAGDKTKAEELAREAVRLRYDLKEVVAKGYTPGIQHVGDLWAWGEYFLPELLREHGEHEGRDGDPAEGNIRDPDGIPVTGTDRHRDGRRGRPPI